MKLSEMQSSPDVGLPQRAYSLCVAGKLVSELEEADQALFAADDALSAAVQADDRPKRSGVKSPLADLEKAAQEAAERCDSIRARMQDHTVVLHLQGVSNGEWRQWVTRHPARDDETDPAGAKRDVRWAGGFCNIDALIADLGSQQPSGARWITKYGDEDPTEASWSFVSSNAAPGDLTSLASAVVGMQEQPTDLGKSRVGWLADRRNETDSE